MNNIKQIRNIESGLQSFLYALREKTYLHYSGKKSSFDLSELYLKYSHLFSLDTVNKFSNKTKGYLNVDNNYVLYMAKFITDSFFGESVKEIDSKIANRESVGKILFNKEEIPYRSLLGRMYNAKDRSTCFQLDSLRREFTEKSNKERWERICIFNQKATDIGYDNYAHLCGRLKKICLTTYYNDCKQFLKNTRDIYFRSLDKQIPFNSCCSQVSNQRSDIFLLARAKEFDFLFSKDNLLPSISKTLADIGITLSEQKNIHIDNEDRVGKSSRPFCIAIDPPNDIRLVTQSTGGREDYVKLYHEMGHAQHWGHTRNDLSFVFKCLGDYGVTEGYALLFQSLLHNQYWINENCAYFQNVSIKPYLELSRFLNMYLIRRYVVKFIYEYELFNNRIEDPCEFYAEYFSDNLGVKYYQEDFLLDVDVGFYSLNYIRAWLFENRLREYLVKKYGNKWFCNEQTGKFLREIWGLGQKNNVEEIIAIFDNKEISVTDLNI